MDHPEGAGLKRADRVDFDRRVRLEFRGTQLSFDGGLLEIRELVDALGLSHLAATALRNTRRGKNTLHRLDGLFRQSVFGRLAGYEDVNDADHLPLDPVMRQMWVAVLLTRQRPRPADRSVRDRDAGPSRELGSAGRPERPMDRPVSRPQRVEVYCAGYGQFGQPDPWRSGRGLLEWAFRLYLLPPKLLVQPVRHAGTLHLRHGNVHSADRWWDALDPVIVRYADRDLGGRFFRNDAAYAIPAIYERLEEARFF